MSELKEWTASEIEEYDDARLELAEDGKIDCTRVYIKSEADKVIAELQADYKEACDRLQTANLIKDEQLAATRHQKYKRCLAMAKWCCDMYDKWMMIGANALGLGNNGIEYSLKCRWKVSHYMRYQMRWLELAKKFKEAK